METGVTQRRTDAGWLARNYGRPVTVKREAVSGGVLPHRYDQLASHL